MEAQEANREMHLDSKSKAAAQITLYWSYQYSRMLAGSKCLRYSGDGYEFTHWSFAGEEDSRAGD